MGVIQWREGGVTVQFSEELDRLARNLIDELVPGLLAALEAEVGEVLAVARSEWPIKTGKSNKGLVMVTEIQRGGELIVVGIRNDVPYAPYVRPKEWFGATTAWSRLVRLRMSAVNKQVVRKFQPILLEAMRKATHGH